LKTRRLSSCHAPAAVPATDTLAPPDDLTAEQQDAFTAVYDRLARGERFTALGGYAGTGKTYLAGRLVAQLQDEDCPIAACAPTHKAAQVLREKLISAGCDADEIETHTIHALLGLRLVPDGEGGYELEQEPHRVRAEEGVVVVDEASMVGAALWEHVDNAPGLQWVFAGDPAQLPPVNEDPSPALDLDGPTLSEIVRQQEGSPILRLAARVRQGEPWGQAVRFSDEAGGVAATGDAETFVESAIRNFEKDAFDEDAAFARLLCYRNRTVRRYNDRIRAALHGEDAPRFQKGEWLVGRETWRGDAPGEHLISSEEVRVCNASETHYEAPNLSTWKVWELKVRGTRDTAARRLVVLHEEEEERYENELQKRLDIAKSKSGKWKQYYRLRERFAEVDYAYAMTVHRAQGSTFDTAFVDGRDVQACRGPERQALLYVAVTRPVRRLALLV
jgi:exodeoxyribonuclease-5